MKLLRTSSPIRIPIPLSAPSAARSASEASRCRSLSLIVRILAMASSGEGIVNGRSVTRQPLDVRRSIGYMPDSFGVYDGMKVWEFLDFFALAYQSYNFV